MTQSIRTTPAYKSSYGWKAETSVPLEAPYELRITTLKRIGGKLATTANRVKLDADGLSHSFIMLGDFHEAVISEAPTRITEKVVTDQHRRALLQLDAIRARCAAHYATKSTETADA